MKIERSHWRTLPVLLTVQLLAITDIFIVNVALPSIRNSITANNSQIQMIVTAYMVGFASFMISSSKLGDQIGRKLIFLTGISLFMLASLGCAISYTALMLIIFRFLQGIGSAMMVPPVLTYIQLLFKNDHERTKAIGWYGIVIGAGTLLGQLLGGYFASLETTFIESPWRLIFLINIPVCIAVIFTGKLLIPESKNPEAQKNDYIGLLLLTIGLLLLIYSLSTGNDDEWSHSTCVMMIIALLFLLIFVQLQFKNTQSFKGTLISMNLFKYKDFNLALIAISLLMIMIDSYFFILTIFLQNGYHLSPLESGYVIIVQGLGFMLASALAPKLYTLLGIKSLIGGLVMIIFSMILQATCYSYETGEKTRYLFMIIHGAGVALVLPPLANIALKGIPDHLAGNASGVYATFQQIFGAIGIAVCGNIFFGSLHHKQDFSAYYHAFQKGIAFNIACLLGVMIILIIFSTNNRFEK